ncbi:MAG TPA: polysaccharide biosynthesis tyrosine autokinase [Candidatus Limnocylindria bacterium]|nr:polysaccharide biosynthesis tyrosine autokinase [Candidatus Limnocylindria bacterium]
MDENNTTKPQMAANDEANKLREYWHVILERRWLIIAVFSVFVALGALWAFQATPIFQAVARLQIDPETGGVLSIRDVISVGNKDQDYLQTQYKNLMGRSLIDAVITKLKLDEDDRYKKAVDKVEAVSKDIDIVPIRLTRLVEVMAKHPNPRVAENMANTLLEIFLQQNQDHKTAKAMAGFRMLKQEAGAQEADLTTAIESLQKYRKEKGMVSLVDDLKQLGENIDALGLRQAREGLDGQNIRTADALKRREEADRWIKEGREVTDLGLINEDPLVRELKKKLADDESALKGLRTRYRDKHPKVIEILSVILQERERLKEESQRAFDSIISQANIEVGKQADAVARFKAAESRVSDLNEAKTTYDILNRKRERAETMYQMVLQKTKEYDLNSKDTLQNMVVVDHATTPLKPVKPNKPLILAGSVFGGLAVALGLAFFINILDDSIKSQEDVESYLRLPFLGYIPNIRSASVVERDLQAHLHPTSSAAEGFRTLRAAVSLARNAEKLRNIAVTSTIPSEGKSLVASNFAIVTAQTGLKTLLVDADLRRPSVHKAFQLQSPIGLSAYLADRVRSIDEIVHTTDVPNLDVVCCGATPSNPSELISSKRMLQFLEEAATRYDRVVLDCPPVSAVADPLVVGAMCDGIMFVTKFNKIRREHALRSVQRIQEAGIYLIGLVLNDIDFEGKDSYYYSYHYYQNRYYSSHYKGKASPAPATTAAAPKDGAKKA